MGRERERERLRKSASENEREIESERGSERARELWHTRNLFEQLRPDLELE